MNRPQHIVWALALTVVVRSALAAPPPASLNNCQNAVKVATKAFVTNKVMAIGTCLQAVSTAHAAPGTCVTQFRRIKDSRGQNKQLSDKLAAAIIKKCDPSYQTPGGSFPNTHTLADIIGSGAGVPKPLDAENLNASCSHYGGDGAINTLQEWIDCIVAAAECAVDSTIASQYPRGLEWLNLVKPSMLALVPPVADPTKVSDAVAALDAVEAEIDGPDNDNIASIQCGGIVSTGTAVAANCLAGTTFSSATAGGVSGTMPNNGAVTLTPSTTDQPIALGYHNGAGTCVGDPDLVSANIKNGVNLFGINGSSSVVDTSGATATTADMVSGKTAYVNGSLVTGTVPAGSNVSGANGLPTFTIPDGRYSGSKTATANDTNLVASNITNGVSIFGVTGTVRPAQTLKTDQTTCSNASGTLIACAGTGQDGELQKGVARSYTDNGDGTITESKTGLMWEKLCDEDPPGATCPTEHDMDTTYTWTNAFAKITSMNTAVYAGHSDWRLPNVNELQTLAKYGTQAPGGDAVFSTPCVAPCSVTGCSCTKIDHYWSSSTVLTSTTAAFVMSFVNFNEGGVLGSLKTATLAVRAVRGGS